RRREYGVLPTAGSRPATGAREGGGACARARIWPPVAEAEGLLDRGARGRGGCRRVARARHADAVRRAPARRAAALFRADAHGAASVGARSDAGGAARALR